MCILQQSFFPSFLSPRISGLSCYPFTSLRFKECLIYAESAIWEGCTHHCTVIRSEWVIFIAIWRNFKNVLKVSLGCKPDIQKNEYIYSNLGQALICLCVAGFVFNLCCVHVCWSWPSSTLFKSGILFIETYARIAGPQASKESALSTSHLVLLGQ